MTSFFDLVRTGTSQSVQAAISNGADVNARNSYDRTPLIYAAGENGPEVITVLLKAGADLNAKDFWERTALDCAQKNASLKGTDAYQKLEEAQY